MKLLIILRSFSSKDWDQFSKYNLLYNDRDSRQFKLLVELRKNMKKILSSKESMTTNSIHTIIKSRIPRQTFSNMLTALGNQAEEYLGWSEWKATTYNKFSDTLKAYAERGLTSLYNKTRKKYLAKSQEKISVWSEYHRMHALYIDYYYQMAASEDLYKLEFKNLLDSFYTSTSRIAQILLIEIKNREHLLKEKEDWLQHEDFLTLHYDNDTALSNLSDQLILMSTEKDDTAYQYLVSHLTSENMSKYAHHINYSILTYCINYLVSIIKSGHPHRANELMGLQKLGLKHNLLTINKTMSLRVFLNVVGVASKLKDFDSAYEIITDWSSKVDVKNSQVVKKLGEATMHFYQNNFTKVIKSMVTIDQPTLDIKIKARWLYLIANFEENGDNINLMKSLLRNFNRFIDDKEIHINVSTFLGLRSSVKILTMLTRNESYDKVANYYKNQPYIFERTWIVNKIKCARKI
jgi:hypothetical protein